jgi:hypothetical protein
LTIADIVVGEHRRQDAGDIQALADSIRRFGLLHPVVVDAERNLVAGGRRLLACAMLGWDEVEVRPLGELTASERREIELEENLCRKDLTEYERSRILTELATTAAEVLTVEADLRPDSGRKSRGHQPEPGSLRKVSERIGVPRSTIQEAQSHIETADAFPFMQSWKQYQVLEAHESLAQLPEPERAKVAALLNQPGVPPRDAIAVVRNVAAKPVEERERIYTLAVSPDSRDRSAALAAAAEVPPMPDPRLTLLDDAGRALRTAERMFPGDPANSSIATVRRELKVAYAAVEGVVRGAR